MEFGIFRVSWTQWSIWRICRLVYLPQDVVGGQNKATTGGRVKDNFVSEWQKIQSA
jgi:hypothetical protein